MMIRFFGVFFAALLTFSAVSYAQSGEPRLLAKYDDWSAYMFVENGNKVCYMISEPKADEGQYTRRGSIYALITNRPSEGTKDVFSYITGYEYKSGSDVKITIDDKAYTLFTQDDTAWAPDAEADRALANAIQSGSKMVVEGISSRGTSTRDTFSLKGSSKAYDRIDDEC